MKQSLRDFPKLSIIVATWNAGRTLQRCIDSIKRQTFTAWELLIADGASNDDTIPIIERNSRVIGWWQSAKDQGIYDAWNQALVHARGDFVCFLGADDAWAHSGALADLFTRIGDAEVDLVTSVGAIFDPHSGKQTQFGNAWNYDRLGRRMVVCHPGMLHRRALFQKFGLFDVRYRIAGDLDFLLRLPRELRTRHIETTSVLIESAGVSRRNVLARLREQREILKACNRYGLVRAYLVWVDKLWRYPLARLLGIPH